VLEETYYIIGYALPALLRFKISEEFLRNFQSWVLCLGGSKNSEDDDWNFQGLGSQVV
jgi:hypothetical protein